MRLMTKQSQRQPRRDDKRYSERKKHVGRCIRILGACNPTLAHEALEIEDKVGTMLPCNVVVQDVGGGNIEIAAIDPVASMLAIDNLRLKAAAERVQAKLRKVIEGI
jgi:uncharacterized protein (DUF302 family)